LSSSSEKNEIMMSFAPALAYGVDAVERSVLFWDVMRRRGNAFFEQSEKEAPDVLHFQTALVRDGRTLPRPVNYRLLQVFPATNATPMDPTKRPFVVFDPRAGQGPGIGGFKPDSEIGLALANGHPVYFVSFLTNPVPGQTIEDVCAASAAFVREVTARHPEADKPCLIGNCQAGWQLALMSSLEPHLAGVLILAGAPLSYWAGVRGQSSARYTAGLTLGSWVDSFASDLGGGLFDGAWLVQSFELGNPSHTFCEKPHRLYAKVDTEAPRYLAFERWWGAPILLTGEEMQFMADELFIGNRLTRGKIQFSDGRRVDMRHIQAPIVVFCSRGDDITPPQQALDWILDLYACDADIVAREQTIVYAMHEHIGHLGLFVASSVVSKEHLKFISNIDSIEALPPGLYEAKFVPKSEVLSHADLATGDYVLRFEKRTLDDIRALGVNDRACDLRFETVARLSENMCGLYSTFASPFVRACATPALASCLRACHPLRLAFGSVSDRMPGAALLASAAAAVQANRHPVDDSNPLWSAQEACVATIASLLESSAKASASAVENWFEAFYGAPFLQASLGLRARTYTKPMPEQDVELEEERAAKLTVLAGQTEEGGLAEAAVRGLLYVIRAEEAVDERAYRMLERLQTRGQVLPPLSRQAFHALARRQYMMLVLDEERAVEAIPLLLDHASDKEVREALALIRGMFEAIAPLTDEENARLNRLTGLFAPAGASPHRRRTDL